MNQQLAWTAAWLVVGIGLIILLTAKYKVHAFFALLMAAMVVGAGTGIPVLQTVNLIKDGFGSILKSLGLIIILGSTLGLLLEKTGCTAVMAGWILKITGHKRAALAMSLTGIIVGLPIFCDSGYIVLSGLNNSLAKKTANHMAVMSVSLGTGLYAVHCLIPPHPGAAAAASTLVVDYGKLIVYGIMVALPAMIAGHIWAFFIGRKQADIAVETMADNLTDIPVWKAFLPLLLPILLIGFRSFLSLQQTANVSVENILAVMGEPSVALAIGILTTLLIKPKKQSLALSHLLADGVEKAGSILIIIGAGGAFGAVLAATNIGAQFNQAFHLSTAGLWFPFLLTFVLKTAQGSSTVAIITAASIVQPLLIALGFTTDTQKLLVVLSMGAGSMMISHANDAYFWVISRFSGIPLKTMLKVYSLATLIMGTIAFLTVLLLQKILL